MADQNEPEPPTFAARLAQHERRNRERFAELRCVALAEACRVAFVGGARDSDAVIVSRAHAFYVFLASG